MDKYIISSEILDLLDIGAFEEIEFYDYDMELIEVASKENFELHRNAYLEHYKYEEIHSAYYENNIFKIVFFLQQTFKEFPSTAELYNIE